MSAQIADEVDRRIIDSLREDGRRPFRQIAQALGVSESTVRARYSRLSSLGILQVSGIPDLHAVGTVEGHVSVQVIGSQLGAVSQRLAQRPEVRLVAEAVGSADIFLDVVFPNLAAFQRFVRVELPGYDGVHLVEYVQTGEIEKDAYVWVS